MKLDNSRIDFAEFPVAESPGGQSARREIVDDNVGFPDQILENPFRLWVTHMHAHPVLIVILDLQAGGHVFPEEGVRGDEPHLVSLLAFELDHLGPEFGKIIACRRAKHDVAYFEHPNAFERFRLIEKLPNIVLLLQKLQIRTILLHQSTPSSRPLHRERRVSGLPANTLCLTAKSENYGDRPLK